MSKSEMIARLKELQSVECDIEQAHIEADNILCKMLELLKQYDIVDEYRKIDKWWS